ncbi:MAG: xylose isomerase [Bacteroidetes bacterium]|nr:MAG: xylose isomerase [Bacteroidota bacterium]
MKMKVGRFFFPNALESGIPGTEVKPIADAHQSFFEFSLGQWSLHHHLFENKISNLDFPEIAREKFNIGVVEYVNQFFMDKAEDSKYLNELLKRCRDNGVKNHLIMCDNEGPLADVDSKKRAEAVENHHKWIEAAYYLGCSTIRVNTFGEGNSDEVKSAAVESLSELSEYAEQTGINIIVENHGGYTSDGLWLQDLMKKVNKPNVGTLPDFGNFCTKRNGKTIWDGECIEEYDRYKGVMELMPFAKGVSAKAMQFDEAGNCVETDFEKMMRIVKESGFHGYVGIEYSGKSSADEEEGIRLTKKLIQKVSQGL